MILSKDKKIYIIDFGLGFISNKIEDKAVDLHLIKQALEAKHFQNHEKLFQNFKKGYIFQDSKKYSFPSASHLYNTIKDSPATKKYVPVIYLYWHYSKYEHFGLLTAIMPNENFNGIIDITTWDR